MQTFAVYIFDYFLITTGLLFSVAIIFFGFRNQVTFKTRIYFLDHRPKDYNKLPLYEDMVWSPKYFHLWTINSWEKWINIIFKIKEK